MRVQSPTPPLAPVPLAILAVLIMLAGLPALIVTAITAVVLAVGPHLGPAAEFDLGNAALVAQLAVLCAFSPPYLSGWVQCSDPQVRVRTGLAGVRVLAGVLWFVNLFLCAATSTLLAALLRG
jgi:hypothetical protein